MSYLIAFKYVFFGSSQSDQVSATSGQNSYIGYNQEESSTWDMPTTGPAQATLKTQNAALSFYVVQKQKY